MEMLQLTFSLSQGEPRHGEEVVGSTGKKRRNQRVWVNYCGGEICKV